MVDSKDNQKFDLGVKGLINPISSTTIAAQGSENQNKIFILKNKMQKVK